MSSTLAPNNAASAITSSRVVVSSRLMPRLRPSICAGLCAGVGLAWIAAASTVDHVQRVEEVRTDRDAGLAQHAGQDRGETVGAARDAVRPSARGDGVCAGHHRQQHLRGADVGGRLLAADVLLAVSAEEPVGRLASVSSETRSVGPASSACTRHGQARNSACGRRSRTARRSAACCPRRCPHPFARPAISVMARQVGRHRNQATARRARRR